jgi:hypothetical protein
MSELSDLLGATDHDSPANVADDASVTTLHLPQSAGDEALLGVVHYFGQDDRRDVVRIVHGGSHVGYLTRTRILQLVGGTVKDFGGSAGWTLPGKPTSIDWIELRCPVADCPTGPHFEMVFDEDDPPRCTLHPDQKLARVIS